MCLDLVKRQKFILKISLWQNINLQIHWTVTWLLSVKEPGSDIKLKRVSFLIRGVHLYEETCLGVPRAPQKNSISQHFITKKKKNEINAQITEENNTQ